MVKYIPVQNFRCRKCGVTRVSLHRHDWVDCRCGNFIDGGFDYGRRGGNFKDMESLLLYLKVEEKPRETSKTRKNS